MKSEQKISEKQKLELIKSRLEKKQKLISIRERKIRIRKVLELGELIVKSGLGAFCPEILFGALLEIKNLSTNQDAIDRWDKLSKCWMNSDQLQRLIVNIKAQETDELKMILKNHKFKWNAFRQEWYGFGKKEELLTILGRENADVVEVI